MPSPRAGTVTPDVTKVVQEYKAGKVEFRNDDGGNIHAPVGKKSFKKEQLVGNVEALIEHLRTVKPASAKGTYIQRASLSATPTPPSSTRA